MLPAKFGSILPSSFRGEDFFKQIKVKFKLQKCAAYQDLPTLQF
jgi:hypothetical protein